VIRRKTSVVAIQKLEGRRKVESAVRTTVKRLRTKSKRGMLAMLPRNAKLTRSWDWTD